MTSYMLLFWAPKHVLTKPRSPEQARESGEKWHAWAGAALTAGDASARAVMTGEPVERTLDADHFAHHLGVTAWTPQYASVTRTSGKVTLSPFQ